MGTPINESRPKILRIEKWPALVLWTKHHSIQAEMSKRLGDWRRYVGTAVGEPGSKP
jgi:hypothetical protein